MGNQNDNGIQEGPAQSRGSQSDQSTRLGPSRASELIWNSSKKTAVRILMYLRPYLAHII
jgi:hypothetical protein